MDALRTPSRRRPGRATVGRLGLAIVAALILAPAAAPAATRTATSPATGMDATLEGARLTFSPGDRVSQTFLRSVRGKTVAVACVSGAQGVVELISRGDALPTGSFDVSLLGGGAPWPFDSRSFTFSLPRDVSEQVDGCFAGRSFELGATFGFTPTAQVVLADSLPEQRLQLAHGAAKLAAHARPNRRFPAARRVAQLITVSEPQMQVAYARNLRAVRHNDIVYVVGRHTSFKRIELAYRQDGGQPVTLSGRRHGTASVEQPEAEVPMPDPSVDGRRRPALR